MSNTSDALAQAVQTIKDLRSADETPPGEQGDAYEGEMDSYVDAVAARFGALVNANDEVVADVRNTDTTSKVTTTEELSVSDSTAVTGGPVGDEGDLIPLQTVTADISTSLTNTTYSLLTDSTNTPRVRGFHLSVTNITSYQISFASIAGNNSGGTTSLRLRDATGALIENTTSGVNAGAESSLTPFSPSNSQLFIEGKVSGGTGYFRMPTWTIWGVVG